MPCGCLDEKRLGRVARSIIANDFENQIHQYATQVIRNVLSGQMDPVIAGLVLRRNTGMFINRAEPCDICKRDLKMAVEFDQLMIDAKTARLTYAASKWRAFKMFWRFQWNVLRAVLRWVIGI
jgi:hypothetical protein